MPQSLVQVYTHIVYSTKDRVPYLENPAHRDELFKFMRGLYKNLKCPIVEINGVADHIHVLCRLSSTISISELLAEQKRDSSKYVKTLAPELSQFYWQGGYGAFSVSPSHVPQLIEYIKNQVEHHRRESFQDEFRRLLKKYDIEYDERYVWD